MKLFSKVKGSLRKVILAGAVVAAVSGVAFASTLDAYAGDCGNNSVIKCGVSNATDINKRYDGDKSIRNIFSWYGISSTEINNLKNTDVKGYVYKDGTVKVNGKTVATGALTGGRQYISGSTKHTVNGTVFYSRTPSVSFRSSPLSAVVSMKDGVFQFAVINDCGNPVKATPLKPNYTISKEVRVKGASAYVNSVSVKAGTHVQYRVTVKSTGKVPVVNAVIKDSLPSHIQYVNNTLKRDGKSVSADSAFFAGGVKVSKIDNGDSTVFTFEAIVGPKDTASQCTAETLRNKASVDSPALPSKDDTADVKKSCLPKPAYACVDLSAKATTDPMTYTFTGKASATNSAKITGYTMNFGDGTSKAVSTSATSVTQNHTYAKEGTYTAILTVNISVDGTTKKVTSAACQEKVTVKKVTPVYACNSLTADKVSRTEYNFTGQASASNGASLTGYTFDFGDGQKVTTSANTNTAKHTYANPGTYTATLTALVSVNGVAKTATSPACTVKITVPPVPAAECTGLTATIGENRSVVAKVTYVTSGGATLSNISYDFGDNTAPVNTTSTTANHTYAADGSYTIVATLSFKGAETVPDSTCQAPVNFETPNPIYTCDALDVTKGNGRMVTISNFKTTAANGAVYKNAEIKWGDNATVMAVNPVGQTHTYAADGTYTISVVATFMVNGQEVTAGGVNCQKQVSFNTTVTPPTELVNTGAGGVAGLFAATTLGGAVAYRWFLGRRLSRDS